MSSFGRVGLDAHPVAEAVEARGRKQVLGAATAAELDEALHPLVVPLQHRGVAVHLVDGPGADDAGIRPGRAPVGAGHLERRHLGKLPVLPLGVGEVQQPLGEEGLHVGEEAGGADVDLGVPGPAEALVALGAVRGDVDEVGPLGPPDVAAELVHRGVGAGELTGSGSIAAQGEPGQQGERRLLLQPADLDVAKPVEGEARLPGLAIRISSQDVDVGGPGASQIGGVDRSVGVDPLGEAKGQLLARPAADPQPGDSGEVLSHVEHEDPGLGFRDRRGTQLFEDAYRRGRRGGEGCRGRLAHVDDLPGGIVETGSIPGRHLEAGVIRLPHEEVGVEDGPGRGAPVCIARDGLHRAVSHLQAQHRGEADAVSVVVTLSSVADVAGIPAVRDDRAEGVRPPPPEQGGHVVGVVVEALRVVGPPRGEPVPPHALAVEPYLVDAERGRMERGPRDLSPSLELPTQVARGWQE